MFTFALAEIEQRLQELSKQPPETHTEADTLMFALAMLLAGQLETMSHQIQATKTITLYRKIKGMGNQPS